MTDGPALAERLKPRVTSPVTRFAPSPTGQLHIGHVVNAVFVWGLARVLGGSVLLRIEDHDRQRCRPDYETAILDDLDWLGFEANIFPTRHFRAGRSEGRQSERDHVYRERLAPLIERGLVYACDCSRKSLDTGPYRGRCRERRLPLSNELGWRLMIEPGDETFDDGLLGPMTQCPAEQCGDVLVRDRAGNWTYQWAATSDDTVQSISLVIRGEDLVDSTGRQIHLARLLGRQSSPVFVHHPLVMKSPVQKLSKADRDSGLRDLRAAGWSAERVIGEAAWLAGLQPTPLQMPAADVPSLFSRR